MWLLYLVLVVIVIVFFVYSTVGLFFLVVVVGCYDSISPIVSISFDRLQINSQKSNELPSIIFHKIGTTRTHIFFCSLLSFFLFGRLLLFFCCTLPQNSSVYSHYFSTIFLLLSIFKIGY